MKLVIFGDCAFAEQGVDHRRFDLFGELEDGLAGVRNNRAMADEKKRTLGLGQVGCRLLQ